MRQFPFLLLLIGCVSDSGGSDAAAQGDEGGPCFSNGTCNAGLVCVVPNKCVRADAGAPETSTPDVITEVGADVPPGVDAGPCPSTGLLAWWKAENTNDTQNFIPLNNVAGVSFVTGQVGQAFSFSGTSFLEGTGANSKLDNMSSLTIEAWIQPNSTSGVIFSRKSDVGPGFEFSIVGGKLTFLGSAPAQGASTLAASIKHHVAVTFSSTAITLYLDGTPDGSTTTAVTPLQNDNVNVRIGSGHGAADVSKDLYLGWIDELAIYSKRLDDTQIVAVKGGGPKCN